MQIVFTGYIQGAKLGYFLGKGKKRCWVVGVRCLWAGAALRHKEKSLAKAQRRKKNLPQRRKGTKKKYATDSQIKEILKPIKLMR